MSKRKCAYCGIEEDTCTDLTLSECPVCGTIHCPVCGAMIEFAEHCGTNEDGEELVEVYRSPVCKVHLSWNILEGIKRRTKEEEDDEEAHQVTGFDIDIPEKFIYGDVPALEFPELTKNVNSLGALVIDKIAAYRLGVKRAVRVRIKGHKVKGGTENG